MRKIQSSDSTEVDRSFESNEDKSELIVLGELEILKQKQALQDLRRLRRPFPPSFKFNREEANERVERASS